MALSVNSWKEAFKGSSRIFGENLGYDNQIHSKKELANFLLSRKDRLLTVLDEIDELESIKSRYRVPKPKTTMIVCEMDGQHVRPYNDLNSYHDEETDQYYDGVFFDKLNKVKGESLSIQNEIQQCKQWLKEEK